MNLPRPLGSMHATHYGQGQSAVAKMTYLRMVVIFGVLGGGWHGTETVHGPSGAG